MIEAVVIRGLTKRYGHHRVLGGVDLELAAGSLCALLGPNGAGKTTLLGIVSTLVRPTAGKVSFMDTGRALEPGSELRRFIGVLAHDSFLYGGLTAEENLRFYARLYDIDQPEARIAQLLDEVGLESEARRRPVQTFSRGMVQRTALARALIHDPQVLLLDEPFTGLDRTGAQALARALGAARERGRVVMVVSHDLEALAGVADHVVVLRRGRVRHDARQDGGFSYADLKEVYHRHAD